MPAALSLPCAFSSPDAVETKVEKCFEDGTRGRPAAPAPEGAAPGPAPAAAAAAPCDGAAAVVVVVVVVCEAAFELARKRDWEWFEK